MKKEKIIMAKTYDEKIAEAKEKISQYENQLKEILQKQRVQERKDRTRRLIERGAILESLIFGADALTNDQIKAFLEKTITNDYARRAMVNVTAEPHEATPANSGSGARVTG
jgi:hypothetical protein